MYFFNTFKVQLISDYLMTPLVNTRVSKDHRVVSAQAKVTNQKTSIFCSQFRRQSFLRTHKINSQTPSRNESSASDFPDKLTFKRLNIINLLANSNMMLSKKSLAPVSEQTNSLSTKIAQTESIQGINNNNLSNNVSVLTNINAKSSYFFRYSRVSEYKKLGVELASPEKIRKWAERLLPTGRIVGLVLNANTLHHKTLKPLKGGLFCERIFGPTKDFRCACGKTITKRTQLQNTTYSAGLINLLTPTSKPLKRFFCKICEVEYTWALTRRYQLGYISLAFPVTHLWYTKGFSSPISVLLDIHKYDLDNIIYCSQTTSLEKSYEITETGISLKASQVLSFVRKNQLRTFNSTTSLLEAIRTKNPGLSHARFRKRKKVLDLGLEHFEIRTNAVRQGTIEIQQNSQDLGTFADLVKETQNSIQQASLPTYLQQLSIYAKPKQVSPKTDNFYVLFKRNVSTRNRNHKEETKASLLLQSLILPVIIMYSTQFFAPFVFWLLSFDTKEQTRSHTRSNVVATTLLQKIFPQSVENGQNNDVQTIALITQTLTQLKTVFIESLDTLEQFPTIIERQYHKALVQLRTDIQTLPAQTFSQINEAVYKDAYTVSLYQTKELLRTLKLKRKATGNIETTSVTFTQESLISQHMSSLTDQSLTVKVSYFLKQLKDLALFRGSGNIAKFITEHDFQTTSVSSPLTQLAFYFFLYKLKKYQATRFLATNTTQVLDLPYLTISSSNNGASSQDKSTNYAVYSSTQETKPILTFYYNLYGIADDHLWDNINDWNLIKSYITIYPDVMDQVIPAYSHRIPRSSMTNFAKTQKVEQNTALIQYYQSCSKKYVTRSFKHVGIAKIAYSNYETDTSKQFIQNRKIHLNTSLRVFANAHPLVSTRVSKDPRSFKSYKNSSKNHQALAIKAAGAGIINTLLNSITLVELQAMDKHFSFLLKESRKTILSYKTKIQPTVSYLSNQTNEGFSSSGSSGITNNGLQAKSGTKPYLLSATKAAQSSFRQSSRLQVNNLNPRVSATRYTGIDKLMEKHYDLLRRAKIVRKFAVNTILPKAMILKVLPVLPPDLRPIMKMADQIATSDLNRLYQRVLYRNERLNKIVFQLSESISFGMTSGIVEQGISMSSVIDNPSETIKQSEPRNRVVASAPPFGSIRVSKDARNRVSKDARKKHVAEYETQPVTEFVETPLFGYEKHYAQRLLQEAVDNLIDNSRAGANTEKDAKGRALKSLSEVLKGKQGRFRQYLLGKRVDYSGRSVIVVGPKLKIHECGLPREMAVELYLPFIIQYLIQMKYTKTVVGAKTLIARDKDLINMILENVVRGHPIILNRAPTLHRLGFQAFQPILVEGRAILLHPMACTAFNADFDGDQMAVHIPITIEARSEAWRLMLARNNLLSPATGEPIILPSQDMVLGCYYLTTTRKIKYQQLITSNQYFSDVETVLYFYYLGKLHLHTPIWVKTQKTVVTDSTKKPVEIRISNFGAIQEIYLNTEFYYDSQGNFVHQYIRTTAGRILFNLIIKNS